MDNWGQDRNRRRKHRGRFGADDDVFGEADAEDRFDDGRPGDMDIGQHAAGLDYDQQYEQRYEDRQGNLPAYPPPHYSRQSYQRPPPFDDQGTPDRARQFQERMRRRGQPPQQVIINPPQGEGYNRPRIDLGWLPCSSPVFILLLLSIGAFLCLIMTFLAYNSLTRHLGL